MRWMDDTETRALKIERALAMVHKDGRSRYVLCLPGWPISDEAPDSSSECIEWVKVSPGGKAIGRVKYYNRTKPAFSGESE